jgi:hypothetical protein
VAVETTLEVVGIKDALRALNGMDKAARRDLTKRYKEVVKDVVSAIAAALPKDAPLSGFKRGWDPSSNRAVSARTFKRDIVAGLDAQARRASGANAVLPYYYRSKDVKAGVSGKRPRQHSAGFYSHLATFYIRANNKGVELFDMSGRAGGSTPQGQLMISKLTSRFGPPSRVIWPTYEKYAHTVIDAVRDIVNDLMKRTQSEIK